MMIGIRKFYKSFVPFFFFSDSGIRDGLGKWFRELWSQGQSTGGIIPWGQEFLIHSNFTVALWFCWFWLAPVGTQLLSASVPLVSLQQWLLATLGHSVFSLDSLHCVEVAPSEYPHGSPLLTAPWDLMPAPEPQHLAPTITPDGSLWFISWLRNDIWQWFLWWIFSIFPSEPPPLHCFLRFWTPPWHHLWGGVLVCRNFPSFMTFSLLVQAPILKSFISSYLFIFCPTSF